MGTQRPTLKYALAAWGGIAVTTFAVRFMKKRRISRRETRVANQGGLLPQARNAVEALEERAMHTECSGKLALESADATTTYTWKEYYDQVQKFARALVGLNSIKAANEQFGVAVHAFNEPRWFFSAIGALAAGWTVSGIYLTNTYDQAAHVLRTSQVKVLVLESKEALDTTYKTVLQDFKDIKVILLQGGDQDASSRTPSYEAFINNANTADINLTSPKELPDDAVASLVYTSGTTGNPKAVELTHRNITSVCAMMHARIPLQEGTKVVSYLPLSHIAAMGIDMYSSLFCGAEVHFADSNALKGSLKDTLLRVRPTLFFGVPRVWEKMAAAMQAAAAKNYAKKGTGKVLKAIGSAAKTVGGAWWSPNTPELVRCCILAIPFGFFKGLAYRKIRVGCGLDRCKLLYTGAAPLPAETMNYLCSLDMPLLEVFGMSESTGAIAVCGPTDVLRPLGACGRALPGGTLEIGSDGEILWSGDNNMLGYKGLPAATEAAFPSATGRLHTGDIGKIDESGYLYITGRKKDLIITAGGENVAPTPIEESILSLLGSDAGHVVLIGDQRKFLTVLVAPAEGKSIPAAAVVEAALKEYNTTYAKSRAQKVQKAHVLEYPFDVSTGELTPTMKVKRAFVATKYGKDIEAMYADDSVKLVGYSSMNIGKIEPSIA